MYSVLVLHLFAKMQHEPNDNCVRFYFEVLHVRHEPKAKRKCAKERTIVRGQLLKTHVSNLNWLQIH